MRPTGIAVAVVGMLIIVFSLIASNGGAPADSQPRTAGGWGFPDLSVPLVVASIAIITGLAMYFLGGRGYFRTHNPAIRN